MGTLYVVDTDASVREALSRLAESAGFEPMPCKDAEDFLGQGPHGNGACALVGVAAAVVIGGAERAPRAAAKLARHVDLRRIQRVLFARIAVEELVVAGEPGDARGELDRPPSERLRDTELRLAPTMRSWRQAANWAGLSAGAP